MLYVLAICFLYHVTSAEYISNCINRTASDTYCYIRRDTDWVQAQKNCKNIGSDVGLPQDQIVDDHQRLLKIMTHLKLETIWLSLRKQKLGNWTWVNNGSGHNPRMGKTDGQCGAYTSDGSVFHAVKTHCFLNVASKYICQHNSTVCPSVVPRYNCIIVDGQAVSVHGGVYDWFTARAMCRNIGADLVHTDKTAFKKDFEKIIEFGNAVFVGLYREDWMFTGPRGSKTGMKTVFWQKRIENNHSCAVLNRSNAMWNPSSCDARHPYFCQIYKTSVDSTLRSQSTGSPTSESSFTTAGDGLESKNDGIQLLLLVTFIFAGVLITSVIISFLAGRRCSMVNRTNRHEDVTTYYSEIEDKELSGHGFNQRSNRKEGKLLSDGFQVPHEGRQKHLYEEVTYENRSPENTDQQGDMDENRSTAMELESMSVNNDCIPNPNIRRTHKCAEFAQESGHAAQDEMVGLNDDITTMIPNPVYVSAM